MRHGCEQNADVYETLSWYFCQLDHIDRRRSSSHVNGGLELLCYLYQSVCVCSPGVIATFTEQQKKWKY
jgi:hypothetical protein